MSIYLDHNATTPILPEVATAMAECYAAGYANPASQHQEGRRARQRLEQAREEVGCILGADLGGQNPDRVVFTSGGTEANHLAVLGIAAVAERTLAPPHEAVISLLEHPSVLRPVDQLERRGWRIHRLSSNQCGVICADAPTWGTSERTRFVSVMLGNNETGVIQPLESLVSVCAERKIPVHTDASQVAGKQSINFRGLGVAAMTVAAHKMHGPLGIGALILRADVEIEPILYGGFQQGGLRAGTESVALAVGMATALQAFEGEQVKRPKRMSRLRDRFEAQLLECISGLVIVGRETSRLPGTANLAFVGLDRRELFLAFDMAGVCCSTGSACASGSSEPSPVLKAMGLPDEIVNSSLRFSLGATTTESEIDDAVQRIREVCGKLTNRSAR